MRPSGLRRQASVFSRRTGLAHIARERTEARRRYSGSRVNALILASNSGRRSRQSFNMDSRICCRSRVCIERRSPAILRARISGLRHVARVARDRGEDRLRIAFATASACCNSRGESSLVSGGGSAGRGAAETSPSIRSNTVSKSKSTIGTRVPFPRSSSTHPNGDTAWSGWCSLNFPSLRHELKPVFSTALQALELRALRRVAELKVECTGNRMRDDGGRQYSCRREAMGGALHRSERPVSARYQNIYTPAKGWSSGC